MTLENIHTKKDTKPKRSKHETVLSRIRENKQYIHMFLNIHYKCNIHKIATFYLLIKLLWFDKKRYWLFKGQLIISADYYYYYYLKCRNILLTGEWPARTCADVCALWHDLSSSLILCVCRWAMFPWVHWQLYSLPGRKAWKLHRITIRENKPLCIFQRN